VECEQQCRKVTRIGMASLLFPSCSSSTLSCLPLPPFLAPPSPLLPLPAVLPSGECCKLHQQPKSISVYFSVNTGHLVTTILTIFLRINYPNFIVLVWRRHTKFQIGMAATLPAIPLPAPLSVDTEST